MLHFAYTLILLAWAVGLNAVRNVTVSQSDTTQIVYSGSGWANRSDTVCGATTTTSGFGSTVQFSFSGTAFYIYGTTGNTGGVFTIDTDGTSAQVDRFRTAQWACNEIIYSLGGLTDGKHTVLITFIGNSPGVALGYFEWQGYVYTTDTALSSTNSDTGTSTTSSPTSTTSSSSQTSTEAAAGTSHGLSDTNKAIIGGVVGGVGFLGLIFSLLKCILSHLSRKKEAQSEEGSRSPQYPLTEHPPNRVYVRPTTEVDLPSPSNSVYPKRQGSTLKKAPPSPGLAQYDDGKNPVSVTGNHPGFGYDSPPTYDTKPAGEEVRKEGIGRQA